jgi:hypothetical protein
MLRKLALTLALGGALAFPAQSFARLGGAFHGGYAHGGSGRDFERGSSLGSWGYASWDGGWNGAPGWNARIYFPADDTNVDYSYGYYGGCLVQQRYIVRGGRWSLRWAQMC